MRDGNVASSGGNMVVGAGGFDAGAGGLGLEVAGTMPTKIIPSSSSELTALGAVALAEDSVGTGVAGVVVVDANFFKGCRSKAR